MSGFKTHYCCAIRLTNSANEGLEQRISIFAICNFSFPDNRVFSKYIYPLCLSLLDPRCVGLCLCRVEGYLWILGRNFFKFDNKIVLPSLS